MRRMLPVLALPLLLAACQCPFGNSYCPFGHKSPIQQAQMTPEKGTYQAPADKLGADTEAPWSGTTIEAAVGNKPRRGTLQTVTGEVIDVSCYLQLGKHGAKHKECGQKCARAGQPIGLLTAEGDVLLLIAEEHHPRRDGKTESLQEALIAHMAQIVTVKGAATELNGTQALFVSGFAK